jgi:hypothetical protein
MVPPMVVVMVIIHLGHRLFRNVLDRRGGARIDQRQRLRWFGRSGRARNAPSAARPRTLVPFIDILLQLRDDSVTHASAVRLPPWQLPRRDADLNSSDDVNGNCCAEA